MVYLNNQTNTANETKLTQTEFICIQARHFGIFYYCTTVGDFIVKLYVRLSFQE